MKYRSFLLSLAALLLSVASVSSRAEDIDLFSGTVADQNLAPNLLMIFDNAANFSADASGTSCIIDGTATALSGKVGGIEQCALYNVISALDLSSGAVSVNLGIMVYNANGMRDYLGNATCVGKDGGCLVYPLTGLTNTTRPALLAWIKAWNFSGAGFGSIKSNGQATGAVMAEAWQYLYGKTGLSGRDYSSIIPNTACKNFVVFVGNSWTNSGKPGDSTGDAGPRNALLGLNSSSAKNANPAATALQKALITLDDGKTSANTGKCGTVNFPGDNQHETNGYFADEWARYMAANRITTYTVGMLGAGCTAEYAWLLSSMATAGGGTFFQVNNYQSLVDAINTILSEVRSVNSVFAAVSLPVSVNSQGTYLNQVFIGMFRPDPNGYPRWNGNLKQYKMGFLGGNFSLLDADDKLAISSSGSEFIAECARSFWTPGLTSTDAYWTSFTDPNCTGYPKASNTPDGNLVEKGGQGYMLRSVTPSTRVIKTCDPTVANCQTTMTSFDTSNAALTPSVLGTTSTTVGTSTLVLWARGTNAHATQPESAVLNGSAITSGASATHMRPSVHGDVVHSRPAAINFGTAADPKVVVFYGGNDGMLRAVNGNRANSFAVGGSTVPAGAEFWSFLPPEFYGKLLRRYNNGVPEVIKAGSPKDYAMDGPISAYRATDTSNAFIYVGMRRGGRTLYAFEVNKDTLAIDLRWKIGCADDANTNCSTSKGDYTGMAQTWSAPQLFKAGGVDSGGTPLMIMGGGYDATCEDATTYTCTSTRGNRFYVLNALTGVRLAAFNTTRSVIADVTIVPDADGKAKFIYGADLAGNVYRISGPLAGGQYQPMGTHAPADWVITTVASLGCDSGTTCTSPPNRKFMFAPDVVVDGSDYVLLLGSGDREKPTTLSNPTRNYFFMIKDRPDQGNAYLNDAACGGTGGLCLASLLSITQGIEPTAAQLAAKKGWYLQLATSEQVVTGAIAVFGTVYFTTHEPKAAASNACVPNLGTSRAYGIKYTNAAASRSSGDLFIERLDSGLAPDLVVGKVTLDARDGSATVPFCIGCDGPIKPSQPVAPGLVNNPAKIRSYWYIQK